MFILEGSEILIDEVKKVIGYCYLISVFVQCIK